MIDSSDSSDERQDLSKKSNVTNGIVVKKETNDSDCEANNVNEDNNDDSEVGNGSKNSDDDWESAGTILSILLTCPKDHEVKSKPSGVRENKVFVFDRTRISVSSTKADDNGSYINKGNPKKFCFWDFKKAPQLAHFDEVLNDWIVKERDPVENFVDVSVDKKHVYEIKRSYRQNRNNPWLTQTISQVKHVEESQYHRYYLVVYKKTDCDQEIDFIMPRHGNAVNPTAPTYYQQDPPIKENINDSINNGKSTEQIYVELAEKDGETLSETIRNPKVFENRKYKINEKAVSENSGKTDAECIIQYIKKEGSFTKSFHLEQQHYTAINYTGYQLSDIERFCVENSAILSIDTTFEICNGLYLTDTSYPNLALIDRKTGENPHFPGPSFWHFRKNEGAYRRFAGEIVIAKPSLRQINKIGHDLDKAIAKGMNKKIIGFSFGWYLSF